MTNDVNFEHMIKAFSARLLHYIFQTVSILGGGTFENIYSALHKHSIRSFKRFIMNLCFSILIKMLSTTIFILMLQLSSFGQWEPLQADFSVLLACPSHFFEHSCTFWHKMFQAYLFPVHTPESANFPVTTSSVHWRMALKYHHRGAKCAYCWVQLHGYAYEKCEYMVYTYPFSSVFMTTPVWVHTQPLIST